MRVLLGRTQRINDITKTAQTLIDILRFLEARALGFAVVEAF